MDADTESAAWEKANEVLDPANKIDPEGDAAIEMVGQFEQNGDGRFLPV